MSIASKIAGNAIKRAPSGPVSTYPLKLVDFFIVTSHELGSDVRRGLEGT